MTKKQIIKKLKEREQMLNQKFNELLQTNDGSSNSAMFTIYHCFAVECKAIREMIERDF